MQLKLYIEEGVSKHVFRIWSVRQLEAHVMLILENGTTAIICVIFQTRVHNNQPKNAQTLKSWRGQFYGSLIVANVRAR